jgi:hypothetical protein
MASCLTEPDAAGFSPFIVGDPLLDPQLRNPKELGDLDESNPREKVCHLWLQRSS